jgi:two-component system alkaline phosphatase synthesis response regulator PhoP|tara:strand:- start:3064 stop:3759 length:696 start_codon:yes stop_codon:yes gene_type:complete
MPNNNRILLVDDEKDILEFLSYNLKKEGFEVATCTNGQAALDKLHDFKPNLIVLDVMMPGMDGIETCETIRANSENDHIIITFLTARAEDYSQVAGLEAGADDYIYKPIKSKVLVSRVKALLRRKGLVNKLDEKVLVIDIFDLSINREKYVVTVDEEPLALPRKEFEILYLLASKPGKVFNRDEIFEKIWGDDVVVGSRTIDVHVRKLREKLDRNYIETVKGVGYKFKVNE